jgi:Protein of unknown function (DUF1353).
MGIFKSFGKKVVSAIKTVGSAVKTVGESIGMTVYEWVKDPDAISNDITVNNIDILERFIFDPVDEGNIIELKENAHVRLDITREVKKLSKEPKNATLDIYFKKGFKTNGASVPEAFRRLMPTYIAMDDESGHIYNAAAFIHDGLYAYKGEIEEPNIPRSEENSDWNTLTRDECDDILCGIWKKSGHVSDTLSFLGGAGVFIVAGGHDHWGNDDETHCKEFFKATIVYKD